MRDVDTAQQQPPNNARCWRGAAARGGSVVFDWRQGAGGGRGSRRGSLHLALLRHLGRDGFEERLVRGAVGVAVLHPVGDALLGGREGPGRFDDVRVELRVLLDLLAELGR